MAELEMEEGDTVGSKGHDNPQKLYIFFALHHLKILKFLKWGLGLSHIQSCPT